MDILLVVLSILTAVFIVLASINGLKRYTKNGLVRAISKKHRLFGMAASTLSLVYLMVALTQGQLRLIGALGFSALLITGLSGMLFFKLKNKNLYLIHRVMGPIAFILVIIHIIFNGKI